MRSADTFACLAFEEVRIVFAPHEFTGILIDRIVYIYITQIRHGKQARYIGIIHQEVISEAVYLKCIDFTIFRVVVYRIFLQCCLYFLCQVFAFLSQSCFLVYRFQNLSCLTQRRYGEEIGRYQILKSRRIIRRTEAGDDQTNRFHWCSESVIIQCIQCTFCLTLEFIRANSVFALLFLECFQHIGDSLNPFF